MGKGKVEWDGSPSPVLGLCSLSIIGATLLCIELCAKPLMCSIK